MNIKTIARHIALIASLGFAASAHAQLLGGGGLGGSLGGSLSGSLGGSIGGMSGGGGQFGPMGVPVTRGDSLGEVRRAARVPDTEALRHSAALDGNAAGKAAANARSMAGEASGALSTAGNVDAQAGQLGAAGRDVTTPLGQGAKTQLAATRGYGASSAANGKNSLRSAGQGAIAGARQAGAAMNGAGAAGAPGNGGVSKGGSAGGGAGSGGAIDASLSVSGSASASAGTGAAKYAARK